MNELVAAITLWLSVAFGLPEAPEQPRIRYLEPRQITALRYGRADVVDVDDVVAVYEPFTRSIALRDDWDGGNPSDLSVLVHEVVHHLQRHAGYEYRCAEEAEKLAFDAQQLWLGQFGETLETAFGIDALSLKMRTSCLW